MQSNLNKTWNILWIDRIDSTNTFVLKNLSLFKNKTVVCTVNQRKGRGTKQRSFLSVPFKTLAFSILLKNIELDLLNKIPILCAISFVETLKNFSILNCKIKWFNDLLIENKKIAGILCESTIEKAQKNIVAGIGLNLLSTEEELKSLGLFNATSIFSKTNKKIKPNIFLDNFLFFFDRYISNYKKMDIVKQYEKNCQTIGKNLKIYNIKTGEMFFAKSEKFLLDGHLLVKLNEKFYKLNYNEYSIEEI